MKTKAMKNLLMGLLVAVLCVACGEKKNEYAKVIPANSPLVVSVNLNDLGEKASLKDYKALIDMGLMQLQQKDAALYQQVKTVVDDPSQLGLALDEPMYVFALEDMQNGAAVLKVTDKGKLTEFMKGLENEGEWEWREEGDLFWVAGPMAIAISEELMFVGPNSVIMERLLAQAAESSFMATENWKAMNDMKGDMKMYLSTGQVAKMQNNTELAHLYGRLGIDLEQCASIMTIDFQNGQAVINSKNVGPEEMMKLSQDIMDKVDGEHLALTPASPTLWFAVDIDGEAIYALCEKVLEGTPNGRQLKSIKQYLDVFDGEMTFSLNGMFPGSPIPDLTLFAEVKDNTLEQEIAKTLKQPMGISHGMIGDDLFYLTTNKEVAANPGKKLANSTADEEWAGKVDGTYAYFVMESAPLKQMLGMLLNPQKMRQANIVCETIESVEMVGTDRDTGRTVLHLKDKQENALKQLIQMGVQLNM